MAKAGIFTEHVRLLALGTSLPAEHFDALWQALRAVLVSELRKRSLWNASPAYLVGQEPKPRVLVLGALLSWFSFHICPGAAGAIQ